MSAKIIDFDSIKSNSVVFDKAMELLDMLDDEGFSEDEIKEIIIRMWLETTDGPLQIGR
jgi:Ser/Thr protein kinase RdoA (MazF antagonist)